jgi:hypothetical protein
VSGGVLTNSGREERSIAEGKKMKIGKFRSPVLFCFAGAQASSPAAVAKDRSNLPTHLAKMQAGDACAPFFPFFSASLI